MKIKWIIYIKLSNQMNVFFVFLEIMICERFYMLYFLLLIYTSDYDCDVLIHVDFFLIFQVLQLQS